MGTVINSDLELAALIFGGILTASHTPISHANIDIVRDNTAAVLWIQ
jgi:hypothetical protein